MPATVIVGAQWGDEGKGKIVDLLARDSDLVCRYNGGPNAGHTIVADGETYKLRHMPSGILWGKECVIGAGCVVDPGVFIEELEDFEARGISTDLVRLSGERARDHAVAPGDRPGGRAAARQAPDRDDPPRDRPDLRRQGVPPRDPAAGPLRPEDPPAEDRGRARREERLAGARVRRRADRARGARGPLRGLRAAAAAVPRRHVAARRPRDPGGEARAARGRARDAARHRPRHLPVRDLVHGGRRRRLRRASGSAPPGSTR